MSNGLNDGASEDSPVCFGYGEVLLMKIVDFDSELREGKKLCTLTVGENRILSRL